MAIKFVSSINLNQNELQNAVVQNLANPPGSPVEGQIYYDSSAGDKSIYFWDGSGWIDVGGDVRSVTAGAGLTSTGTRDITINVGQGTGIFVNPDSVQLYHLGLENLTDPGADRIYFWDDSVGYSQWLEVSSATGISISGTTLALGSIPNSSLANSSVTYTAGAGLTGGGTVALGGSATLTVGAGVGIQVNADDVQLKHLGLEDLTDPNADRIFFWDDSVGSSQWLEVSTASGINISGTTLQLGSIPNSSLTNSSITVTAGNGLTGGGTVALGGTVTLDVATVIGSGITVSANSIALSNYAGLNANAVTKWDGSQLVNSLMTDDGTTVTIAGNLDVNGTTTTIDSTIVSIGDNMMQYANANVANSVDIGFYGNYVNSGTKYASFFYDASASSVSEAVFTLGHTSTEPTSTVSGLTVGRLVANVTGALTGNASTATALQTARSISITGDATWSVTFDGTANVTSGLTLANSGVTAGSYGTASTVPQIVFDSKGRATSAVMVIIAITASQVTDFTSAVQAIIDGSGAVANVGDGTNTSYAITHNLNSRDVIVQVYDNTTYDTIFVDTVRTSVNVVTLTFATAPASNAYRVVIQRVS